MSTDKQQLMGASLFNTFSKCKNAVYKLSENKIINATIVLSIHMSLIPYMINSLLVLKVY